MFILRTIIGLLIITTSIPSYTQDKSTTSSKTTRVYVNSEKGKGTSRWETSSGLTDFEVEMRGKVELTADDKDIKSISDDGYLEITKTVFGSRRSIVVESLGGGKMKKEYYEGRTKMNWEPNGRQWLNEILPELLRTTGIAAESRVNRMFKSGGTNAVLAEIGEIESDHVKALYADHLMTQPVPAKDYVTIINTLASSVESDHYLATFLQNNIVKFMKSKEATQAVLAAVDNIESDHYKTVIVTEALSSDAISPENVKLVLQAASNMSSDHYKTEVLTSLLDHDNLSDDVLATVLTNTRSIESDHYRTVVLTEVLEKENLSSASYAAAIASVKEIDSDHYITVVIQDLLDKKLTDAVLTEVLNVSSAIGSDHYRTEVLTSLIDRHQITEAQLKTLLDAATNMDSDHYKTIVLQEAISGKLSNPALINLINATEMLDSDHYLTEVLVDLAPLAKAGSPEVKEAFRKAARNVSNETYYGRVMKAVDF